MTEKVRRTQTENNKKLQEAAKRKQNPDKPSGSKFRESPGGRKLKELRDKKTNG